MADGQHQININNALALGRIEQSLQDMNSRLFGAPGQVGALTYIAQQHKEHAVEVAQDSEELGTRVAKLETWKLGTLKWIAGAVAVLTLEGSAVAFYFHSVVTAVKAVAHP